MPTDSRPCYEEIAQENVLLKEQVKQLQEESYQLRVVLERLNAEVGELKRRLDMNSKNSSKPPSMDSPFDKPKPKSLRRKCGRKPGGQQGHPGATLVLVDDPDEVVRHEPDACRGCGTDLTGAPEIGVTRRQVFDLPPIKVGVTEHQLVIRHCDCGTDTTAAPPSGVNAPVQYGPQINALGVYLYAGQFLSRQRTAQTLTELFGAPVCEATITAMTARCADDLGEFNQVVATAIAASQVAGFDETGLRVGGGLNWVHCARTDEYTLITCHQKRGRDGINDAGVLPRFSGVAVHDAWAPYDAYTDAAHQLCCAHVLRELQAVADIAPNDQWCWATQITDALVEMQHLVTDAIAAEATTLDPQALAIQIGLYRSGAQIGINETAARANKTMAKHNTLAHRLLNRQDDYLRFTTNWSIPADNNGSERDIRMVKLRQKVSGCLRTLTGAQHFCAIRSYISTSAKHGRNLFESLVMLTEGQPWLPTTT